LTSTYSAHESPVNGEDTLRNDISLRNDFSLRNGFAQIAKRKNPGNAIAVPGFC
jgi:hypothetical protein